jgi:hypothetical protein
VENAHKQVEVEMVSLLSTVQEKLIVLVHDLQVIQKVEAAAVEHAEVVTAEINLFFDNLIRSIEARRSVLLKEAEAAYQRHMKQI